MKPVPSVIAISPIRQTAGVVSLALALATLPAMASAELQTTQLAPVLDVACQSPYSDAQRFRRTLPTARIISHNIVSFAGTPGRAQTELLLRDGLRLEIQVLFPAGRLRRVTMELQSDRPLSSFTADHECRITEARELVYDQNNRPQAIRVYAADLKTLTDEIALNPPAPTQPDPGGISVGLIDSGVNYTLPVFANHLAFDGSGTLIGKDFWDDDALPFDADTGRSPFFPLHHGSAVMSVLMREAPMARVLPLRYPRPDMRKMADAVDWLAGHDVRIVNLAMGSNSLEAWQAFESAAKKHPQMLFIISAGNDGRDIDKAPVYPAALKLPNTIVVTSSELDGKLAEGSNWGTESVDIMVPGERIAVIDHRGAPGKASGSSFAVPRVSALAVRVLARNPDWHGPELRDWILKRARPLPGPNLTRYGWIPDPSDGP
jgi:hypothetical protein